MAISMPSLRGMSALSAVPGAETKNVFPGCSACAQCRSWSRPAPFQKVTPMTQPSCSSGVTTTWEEENSVGVLVNPSRPDSGTSAMTPPGGASTAIGDHDAPSPVTLPMRSSSTTGASLPLAGSMPAGGTSTTVLSELSDARDGPAIRRADLPSIKGP
jgi:hypothetical protein